MKYQKKPNLISRIKEAIIICIIGGVCLYWFLFRISGNTDPRNMTTGDYKTLLIVFGLVGLYYFLEKYFPVIIYGRKGMERRAEEEAKDLEK